MLKFVNHEGTLLQTGKSSIEIGRNTCQNRWGQENAPHQKNKVALLVLDMQVYFLDPDSHAFIPSALAVLPQIQKLITAFSQRQQSLLFTRHINTTENAGAMSRWWHDLITADNSLSEITPEFDTGNHPVLHKTQYDAFYQTSLEETLHNLNISQVIITGVMTHLCCETTSRSAFVRGFDVFFVVDGTATYNQDFHQASLRNLSHGFATPILTDEILVALDHHAD